MNGMKTLAVLIAALGILVVDALRPTQSKGDDDDVVLFIGSARPLAAETGIARRRRR
jgi:hypothetical protein